MHKRMARNWAVREVQWTENREQILQLKARGLSLRQIAAKLGVGYGTARSRLQAGGCKMHAVFELKSGTIISSFSRGQE
jgi:DNA-binding NarL/FixJ family response regulator